MPKTKNYEFDYEWNGNNQPQKGVNIKTKNPFAKPLFASVQQPSKPSNAVCSTPEQAPTDMEELRQSHPWQKPQWATVDKSPQKNNNRNIDKEAIPKPMLKKTPGSTNTNGSNVIHADDDAIAAMERKLAAAKQKKAELQAKQQQTANAEEEVDQRTKHTTEETKLERARRLAKERELERWRATLKERNERDKAKRAAAALVSNVRDDTAWQTKQSPAREDPRVSTTEATVPSTVANVPSTTETTEQVQEDTATSEQELIPQINHCNTPASPLDDTADDLARQIAQLEMELKQYQ